MAYKSVFLDSLKKLKVTTNRFSTPINLVAYRGQSHSWTNQNVFRFTEASTSSSFIKDLHTSAPLHYDLYLEVLVFLNLLRRPVPVSGRTFSLHLLS